MQTDFVFRIYIHGKCIYLVSKFIICLNAVIKVLKMHYTAI